MVGDDNAPATATQPLASDDLQPQQAQALEQCHVEAEGKMNDRLRPQALVARDQPEQGQQRNRQQSAAEKNVGEGKAGCDNAPGPINRAWHDASTAIGTARRATWQWPQCLQEISEIRQHATGRSSPPPKPGNSPAKTVYHRLPVA